jgi:amidase
MPEPHRLGAKEAARLVEQGELASEALARSCFERIRARDRDLQAWAFVDEPRALAAAKGAKGPLFGVPVGVKDIFDTYDLPTEYGSPIYAGHRPRADSAAAALTRRAGGVVAGKTVTTEFATMVPSRTRNPHDLRRTPGGSSSGSAAAVADGMVPLAFGTQTAGSTIRPGSYCGIVAYKPTYNLLPRAGMKPSADSLDTVGLFARSVEDIAFFARALTGIERLESTMERPRIAICRTHEWGHVAPDMAQALDHARKVLDAGELALPGEFQGLRDAHTAVLWYEVARSLSDEYVRFPEKMAPMLRERCANGFGLDPQNYLAAQRLAADCRAAFNAALGSFDVLLAPAATGEAPEGFASTGNVVMNVVWTLLRTPCVAVPAARGASGMPLGLQVVGRIGDDARTLAAARWIESRLRENLA